jgi:hypothetical protein
MKFAFRKKIFLFLTLVAGLVLVCQVAPVPASADVSGKFIEGLDKTGGNTGAGYPIEKESNPGLFITQMFGTVMKPAFMGVIAMIIFIYGGYYWLTAKGDEEKVQKAKTIIVNTIIALLVIFSAYAIVKIIIPIWKLAAGIQ